jgi:hypothetical protein
MARPGKSSPLSESQESIFPATVEDVSSMIRELENRVTDLKIFMNYYMKELALPENLELDVNAARKYVQKLAFCSVVFLQQYTLLMHGKEFQDFFRDKDLLSSSPYHYSKLCIKWIELLKFTEKDNHITIYREKLVSYFVLNLIERQ